jgi:dTDP-glucose pyrophosphorylase
LNAGFFFVHFFLNNDPSKPDSTCETLPARALKSFRANQVRRYHPANDQGRQRATESTSLVPYVSFFSHTIAVIPAAGISQRPGSARREPLSDAMVPVAGKPAVFWTIQELLNLGVRRICLVIHERDNDLERFVSLLYSNLAEITFVVPDRFAGVGYSVWCGARAAGSADESILVVLGDTILTLPQDTPQQGDWILVSPVEDQDRWCMAAITSEKVTTLFNKPRTRVPANHACIGVYHFSGGLPVDDAHIAGFIAAGKSVEMADLLQPVVDRDSLAAVIAPDWLDVGNPDHLQDAQQKFIQSRSFNTLSLDSLRGTISKKSTYTLKFHDEINYYKLLPDSLKIYFPRIIEATNLPNEQRLTLEYYAYPTLADIFLFDRQSSAFWKKTLTRLAAICADFRSHDYGTDTAAAREIYLKKNIDRYESFLADPPEIIHGFLAAESHRVDGIAVIPPHQAIERSLPALERLCGQARLTPIHGDLCLSNILCEPNSSLIKLVDPRGSFGRQGVLGDQRYDFAKLDHSITGRYDFIVNDLFAIHQHSPGDVRLEMPQRDDLGPIAREFETLFLGEQRDEIRLITAWLFLSMLPLHADKPRRQFAMLATGLKLLTTLFP